MSTAWNLVDGSGDKDADTVTASKSRLRLWLRLLKVSRGIENELRERLRTEFDSTLPRFDVMAALHRAKEPLRMSELSGVLRVSNGNVTGIVERLVNDGLVVRSPVEHDRRASRVALTHSGREHFESVAAIHEGWVDALLSPVDESQASELRDELGRIATHLETMRMQNT